MNAPTIEELKALKPGELTAWNGVASREFLTACDLHVTQCGIADYGNRVLALFTEGIELGMVIMRNRHRNEETNDVEAAND